APACRSPPANAGKMQGVPCEAARLRGTPFLKKQEWKQERRPRRDIQGRRSSAAPRGAPRGPAVPTRRGRDPASPPRPDLADRLRQIYGVKERRPHGARQRYHEQIPNATAGQTGARECGARAPAAAERPYAFSVSRPASASSLKPPML